MIEFDDELKKLVNFQKLGYVATVSSDGTPNLSPKGTIAILDDSRLVFANIFKVFCLKKTNSLHKKLLKNNLAKKLFYY